MSAAEPKFVYIPRPETASESVSGALSAIYSRAIQRYEQKLKGGAETAPEDTKKSENIGTATDKYSGEPSAGSPGRSRWHSRRTQASPSVGELEVRVGRQEVDEAPS